MTIVLAKDYHAFNTLKSKHIKCMTQEEALQQDIRALRIGILNIMPKAETYEFNLLYSLGRSILQINPIWIRFKDKHPFYQSSKEHFDNLYVTFEEAIKDNILDGLIITGSPVEEIPFNEVFFWKELKEILIYSRKNIASTLGICWGGLAIAGIIGLEKKIFPKKIFGVFEGFNLNRKHPITGEFDDAFFCPQSRYAGLNDKEVEKAQSENKINLLAYSKEAGYFIFETTDQKYIAHLGHPEYHSRRIVEEALRDKVKKRSNVESPVNFDINNPINRWRGHRNEFFTQWIKFVYDNTQL